MTYGTIYVARVAMGGSDTQTVKAFLEAEAYDGPSLIIAYSHCIAHGYDLAYGMEQQKAAVLSGHWPLCRYNPDRASLNGTSSGGWIRYARMMQEAGADALELNIYDIPTDPALSAAHVEQRYVDLVRDVSAAVTIPVAVKLGHAFSAFAHVARRLDQVGARGLVLFNRFYQPDFDLENLEVVPQLQLSHPYELLLRIHWVAILYGRVQADLAVTGGVHTAHEVVKAMMAGARVAMMTSALLLHGIEHLATVRAGLLDWMEAHEYASIRQMQGSMSHQAVADPSAFERANYLRVLRSAALKWRAHQ